MAMAAVMAAAALSGTAAANGHLLVQQGVTLSTYMEGAFIGTIL